jgi:protein O-GlcNAc transferase
MRAWLRSIALIVGAVLLVNGPLLASGPASPSLDLLRAREVAGDLPGAIAALRDYVAANPGDAEAGRLLGDLYFRASEPADAEATWKAVVAHAPGDAETHARLGALYAAEGRYPEAIGHDELALPLRSALVALVALHRRDGNLGAWVGSFANEVDDRPFDRITLGLYANLLQATHRENEALTYYSRLVRLAPDQCEYLVSRAGDYIDLHRYDDAVADLQHCLALTPDVPEALADLGDAELEAGRYDLARQYLDRAIAVDPDAAGALIDRGYLEDQVGDTQIAARDYEAAIAADPLRPEAYINLAFHLVNEKAYASAEGVISAGLRAAPGDGRLHYLMAETYRFEGRTDLARLQFRAALNSDEPVVVNAARKDLRAIGN